MITDYLTDRRAAQFEAAVSVMNQEVVYNVDFKDAKDSLGRAFSEANDKMVSEPFFWAGKYESLPEEVSELHWLTWSAHLAPSLLKKVNKVAVDHPCRDAMLELLNEFAPIMEAVKAAKGRVVKGRKPSTTPRKTEERTIENTGTCGCCGKNVKLSGGKLVAHGYTIKYGFQSGNCFGVGYEPVEVSNKAIVAYLEVLNDYRDELVASLVGLDEDNKRWGIESNIRQVESDIKYFDKALAVWAPRALPGVK